ncbi:hypothetical protein Dsin_012458 [Dipteronia sinensis]|uniref:DUF4283 domain-containing protein n=1 Tax=Dipteronia sinensis TaxID=43782 RepID=A0AAE0AI16_9ROSI|nr:hypothetical protein Dsin_012458 [Dipteronia sinensis]
MLSKNSLGLVISFKELNATILALVPKVPNPSKMKDFRPIFCCSTLYKIIAKISAKIIANRIKPCLPDIISPSQSAFVAGRRIGDNISLAQELMRNYHKDISCPRLALKVYLMMAFNMVDWGFLLETLTAFHFPPKIITWIKACLTTPKFSISFNAMEVLSKILTKRIADSPSFKFHWKCDKIKLSHLCFADDLIMLCHGSPSSALVLKAALHEFSLPSGLLANQAKSNIFTSGLSSTTNQQLINLFGYTVGSLPIHYLGIPIISTKLCLCDCSPLVDKVLGRLTSWLNRGLSYAGRLQLIISVLSSLQVNAIILGDSWSWPAAMSIDLVEIRSRMPSYNPNSDIEDSILWLHSSNGIYSASSSLASLRAPHPLIPWFKLVWFPQNIPRMSFILWMAVRALTFLFARVLSFFEPLLSSCFASRDKRRLGRAAQVRRVAQVRCMSGKRVGGDSISADLYSEVQQCKGIPTTSPLVINDSNKAEAQPKCPSPIIPEIAPTIMRNSELHHKKGQQIQLDVVSSSRNSKLHHEEGISITPTLVNNSETAHSSYSNVLKGTHFGPNMHIPAIRPMNLKFYQPSYCGNRKCVSPPLEITENGSKAWKNYLVGYFIEKKPHFSLVNNIAMRLWGNRGVQEVLANDRGFFFFKFLDDEACSNVLESGRWLFAGRMVILKKWHPRLILTKETCSKIPVWVKLFNIPYEYWNEEGLSHIASAVGKPLYADSLTESMKRISYARVCIEIDATCELVDSFDLFMGDNSEPNLGESVEILVEYQWKPKIYTKCKSFSHSITTCLKLKPLHPPSVMDFDPKPKQEWNRVTKGVTTQIPLPCMNLEPLPFDEAISAVNSEIESSLCPTNLPIKIQCNVLSKETCMSTSHAENEPSLRPTNLSIHDQCHDLSKERVVDTSNKFAALVEDGDYRNDQCNQLCDDADQCNDKFAALVKDDDSPSTASPDHSLWHSKIKNIDGVTIKGISSPTKSSSKKKKKKRTAKEGKVNSSHAKVMPLQPLYD